MVQIGALFGPSECLFFAEYKEINMLKKHMDNCAYMDVWNLS